MKIVEHKFPRTGTRRKTKEIILHCSATAEGKDYTVETIEQWHKKRGFTTIGYNYVIYRNGEIHQGRPETSPGAHATNHNSISVGVCYIGGVEAKAGKDGKYHAKDTRTPEQKQAMYELVQYLMQKYKLKLTDVHGHYEFAAKACPSFKMDTFRKEYETWQRDHE